MSIEAMKQALQYIEANADSKDEWDMVASLRQAIDKAEKQGRDEYERGFIDGMQKQMQSSVDKAVNAMSKREWVGLTDEDKEAIYEEYVSSPQSFMEITEAKLKEKNQ